MSLGRTRAVRTGGVLLRTREDGDPAGPAVAFVGPEFTDLSAWDGVVDALPPGLRAVRIEPRGHGLSAAPEGVWAVADLAGDLAAGLDAAGVTGAVLCGASLGGLVALETAARRPDLAGGLVLVGTAARIGTAEGWETRHALLRDGGTEALATSLVTDWLPADRRESPETRLLAAMIARTPPGAATALATLLRDAEAKAAGLALPVLALSGDADRETPPDAAAALAATIPGAEVETLPGAGHLPWFDAPATIANAIARMAGRLAPADRHATGMAVRRAVLGEAHVARAGAETTPFDAAFQRLITEGAWGTLWAGHALSRRERSIVTLALLAAHGHTEEVAMHVRATRNTGASEADIAEAFLHAAVYAGVPAANRAFRAAKAALAEGG